MSDRHLAILANFIISAWSLMWGFGVGFALWHFILRDNL